MDIGMATRMATYMGMATCMATYMFNMRHGHGRKRGHRHRKKHRHGNMHGNIHGKTHDMHGNMHGHGNMCGNIHGNMHGNTRLYSFALSAHSARPASWLKHRQEALQTGVEAPPGRSQLRPPPPVPCPPPSSATPTARGLPGSVSGACSPSPARTRETGS
jgi:hypothetical protein